MKIIAASDSSLLVVFGNEITSEIEGKVLSLFHSLQARRDARIQNLHPGYASLLVDFDPLAMEHGEARSIVEKAWEEQSGPIGNDGGQVEIPVCYGGEFGPDLEDVASHTGLSTDEVIRQHCGGEYRVRFLGFTAGFAYLSGMPEILSMPRLATPRRAVAAGSVGIAGAQTGVYPFETPGGWRLIGRTPLRMFDPNASRPTRVLPGDAVRFVAIAREEYERLVLERA